MSIAERLRSVHARIAEAARRHGRDPADIRLVAVSKTRPAEDVQEALRAGQIDFGENRVQELVPKAAALAAARPRPRWHMVGSLQTNKVNALLRVEGLEMLQSLDRPRLAWALEHRLATRGRRLAVLLEIHATEEPAKAGCPPSEARDLARLVVTDCPHLDLRGLMAMGPREGPARPVFASVAALARRLRDELGMPLDVLSMGMTGDLEDAIAAGSTMVRVGTAVFGPRSS